MHSAFGIQDVQVSVLLKAHLEILPGDKNILGIFKRYSNPTVNSEILLRKLPLIS